MKFSEFLVAEMKRRDMSQREMARWLEVSSQTVNRLVDPRSPDDPSIMILLRVSEKTGVSLLALVEMAYPDAVRASDLSADSRIIAQRIEALPDDMREAVIALLSRASGK